MKFWSSRSLRTQIAMTTSFIIALTLVLSGLLTVSIFRDSMLNNVDKKINANYIAVTNAAVSIQNNPSNTEATNAFFLSSYSATIYDSHGKKVRNIFPESYGKPGIKEESIQWLQSHEGKGITVKNVPETQSSTTKPVDAQSDEPVEWRVIYYRITNTNTNQEGWVAVGLPLAETHQMVTTVILVMFLTAIVLFFISSLISFGLVTRSFKPLKKIESTLKQVEEGDLSQRVPMKNTASEVGHLSSSLNSMFSQIEDLFNAQKMSEKKTKRFVSDASHELRTPLTTIRGFSEQYNKGMFKDDPRQLDVAMQRIQGETLRMNSLVEDLLTLARADEKLPLNIEPIDLQIIAFDAVNDTRVSAPERTISLIKLKGSPSMSAPALADNQRIHQVVSNIISNSLRYTPTKSPLEIAVGTRKIEIGEPTTLTVDNNSSELNQTVNGSQKSTHKVSVIEIIDHGPGIPTESLEKVFERFYRDDTSRARDTGGSGLGLAIVSSLVKANGGAVIASHTEGGGATMTVSLPFVPLENLENDEDFIDDEIDDNSQELISDTNSSYDVKDDHAELDTAAIKLLHPQKEPTPEENNSQER